MFEDLEEKDQSVSQSVNQSVNDKDVCITAPAPEEFFKIIFWCCNIYKNLKIFSSKRFFYLFKMMKDHQK